MCEDESPRFSVGRLFAIEKFVELSKGGHSSDEYQNILSESFPLISFNILLILVILSMLFESISKKIFKCIFHLLFCRSCLKKKVDTEKQIINNYVEDENGNID